jgi:hypothetical protein
MWSPAQTGQLIAARRPPFDQRATLGQNFVRLTQEPRSHNRSLQPCAPWRLLYGFAKLGKIHGELTGRHPTRPPAPQPSRDDNEEE